MLLMPAHHLIWYQGNYGTLVAFSKQYLISKISWLWWRLKCYVISTCWPLAVIQAIMLCMSCIWPVLIKVITCQPLVGHLIAQTCVLPAGGRGSGVEEDWPTSGGHLVGNPAHMVGTCPLAGVCIWSETWSAYHPCFPRLLDASRCDVYSTTTGCLLTGFPGSPWYSVCFIANKVFYIL